MKDTVFVLSMISQSMPGHHDKHTKEEGSPGVLNAIQPAQQTSWNGCSLLIQPSHESWWQHAQEGAGADALWALPQRQEIPDHQPHLCTTGGEGVFLRAFEEVPGKPGQKSVKMLLNPSEEEAVALGTGLTPQAIKRGASSCKAKSLLCWLLVSLSLDVADSCNIVCNTWDP